MNLYINLKRETTMNAMPLDLMNATLEELENLSFEALLGKDIADYNLSSSLPDGTFLVYIEKREGKAKAADVEKGKKASKTLELYLRVHTCLQCSDAETDKASLANRVHIERYNVTEEFGVANLIRLVLGAVGVAFKDKRAIAEVGQSVLALLDQLISGKVLFGVQVKTVEKNGYENTNVVHKEPAFIPMDKAMEYLG